MMPLSKITFSVDSEGITHFNCGCEIQIVGETLFFKPCSPSCQVYQYAMKQAEKRQKISPYAISVLMEKDNR